MTAQEELDSLREGIKRLSRHYSQQALRQPPDGRAILNRVIGDLEEINRSPRLGRPRKDKGIHRG